MKIKLEDGTEVEVADTNPLAVAARELERVKGMGFDSIEAYETDRKAKLDKLEAQTKADNDMIQRQKTELGELRKPTAEPPVKETPKDESVETPEEREARYRKSNMTLQATLTPAERAHAEKEFEKQMTELPPDERALLKTSEGRHAFFNAVFPTKKTDESSPVSLFEEEPKPVLSIAEQVAAALKKDDKGRGVRPVVPPASGSGFVPSGAPAPVKPVVRPLQKSGGVLDQINQLEKQGA